MKECPVTHPISAIEKYTSPAFKPKICLIVHNNATTVPPVSRYILNELINRYNYPFGYPVVPEVYRIYNG